jgi:nucleoside-diphosphate-sugar epimerase
VGSALAQRLLDSGHSVFGMRRDVSALPEGVSPVRADVSRANGIGALPPRLDVIVYAVGAKARDEDAYRAAYLDGLGNVLRVLGEEGQTPRRILFTSSTSVYGQSRGEWVDEDSPTHPRGFAGEIMLSTERLLHGSSHPSTILRLGGIYGPDRTSLLDRTISKQPIAEWEPPHYGNRIHRDDAAGALSHLIETPDPAELYLGVDSEPADTSDVQRWIARELAVVLPVDESPDAPRSGSKRCRNARLVGSGYDFLYPTYREGYGEILRARRPRSKE